MKFRSILSLKFSPMKDEGITCRHGVFVGIPLDGPGSVYEGPSDAGGQTMLPTL